MSTQTHAVYHMWSYHLTQKSMANREEKQRHTKEASPCLINIEAGTNGGSLLRNT